MEKWKGKIAVISGVSSGIGEAIAVRLAENGVIVVGLARRLENMQALASKVKGTIYPIKCDLMKKEEILSAFREIEQKFGGVDLLINNAGYLPNAPPTEGPSEEWEKTIGVNVLSLSFCTQEAMKTMRNRGDNGYVININSTAGHRIYPMPPMAMYIASKHAVTVLTEMLRTDLKEKKSRIRVTSLSPGLVDTPMASKVLNNILNQDQMAEMDTSYPPALTSEDLADAVVYLLSNKPYVEIQELTFESVSKMI